MEKTIRITEDYVSFEVAKLLKEKGFDSDEVGCLGGFYSERCYESGYGIKTNSGKEVGIVYDDLRNCELDYDEYLRPTLQMTMKWLREVHNIFFSVNYFHIDVGNKWLCLTIWLPYKNGCELSIEGLDIETVYEKAIKYCLENLI